MDSSSSSSQNWLAFSLSHPHHYPPATAYDSNVNDCNGNGNSCLDLSMFNSVGPKLEDFLGTNNGGSSSSLAQFSTENNQSDNNSGVYDSIAASFLRGYSSSLSNNGNGNTSVPTEMIDNSAIVPVTTASTVVPVDSSKKAVDTFGQRTSIYRGVTRHRWTGRYEAHLWDNSCRREGQSRKGRQVYLGGYDKEEKAARAYDLAALKYWGSTTTTNFPVCNYEKELEEMKNMSRQEFVASLRRKSSGFSRGASIYRGVTRHHQHGRWQARIGRVAGNKDLYLGTFSTQEEAAEAYDIAAIKFRGLNAVTNFDMSRYDVKSIASSSLPIGGIANKPKASPESVSDNGTRSSEDMSSVSFASQPASSTTTLSFALPIKQDASDYWSMLGYQNSLSQQMKNGTATTTGNNFQSNGTTFMDFSSSSDQSQAQAVFNGGGYVQQQEQQQEQVQQEQENSNGLIPYATPINSYDTSTGYGSWVTPSVHTFQTGKPNISVYQTPIYGME